MPRFRLRPIYLALATLFFVSAPSSWSQEDNNRMLGRQSQNQGIPVLPAPAEVKIDGDLSEWNRKGRIWSFADVDVRDEYSVETAAMWDKEYLYIATIWRDPTPMLNTIDPGINPGWGWKSDALQLRISSDKTQWLTLWHYTPGNRNVLHIETWQEKDLSRQPRAVRLLESEPGGTDLGDGVAVAYRKAADGRGFIQEIRLPWSLIYKDVPEIKPGAAFNLGLEFIWGDSSGTRPTHRYADNLQPGRTSREFFWVKNREWGTAKLQGSGEVEPFRYAAQEWQLQGIVPIEITLPDQARRFTVVIDDEQGNRVRSLGADLSPQDYKVGQKDGQTVVSVPWDLRDNTNNLVEKGQYKARGLYHEGLEARFDAYYYQPGMPPWSTANKGSAWLSDHYSPHRVISAGGLVFISALVAEGGSALIALGGDGKKLWGEHRGASTMAGDNEFIYAIGHTDRGTGYLWRYDFEGTYHPYTLDGKPAPFELDLSKLLDASLRVSAIAVNEQHLFFAMRSPDQEKACELITLDKQTLKPVSRAPLPHPLEHLAFDSKGQLFGIGDGILYRIDAANGKHDRIHLEGVAKPVAFALDKRDHLLVFDAGEDQQIKAFTPQGKPAGAIGKKGGHPRQGTFDPTGIRDVSALAVDKAGLIWATSASMDPRRVTAWSANGDLVHDFIGNAQYSGTGSYLDPLKPDYGYIGSLEFKLDRQNNDYELTRVLWSPDPAQNEAFELWSYPHWFSNPLFIESDASGKKHRYLFKNGGYFAAFYMERGGHYQPVSAIFAHQYAKRRLAGISWPDHEKMTIFWHDTNGDGRVSLDECEIVPETIRMNGFWGTRPGPGLELYAQKQDGTIRHNPVGFDPNGAPKYARQGVEELGLTTTGDYHPVPGEAQVLVLGDIGRNSKGVFGVAEDFSKVNWHWPTPYNSVAGSHRAPMSRPGLVIGGLKFMGVAEVSPEVGSITAIRGNLGQDYYFTTDGLMIGAMFRDSRLPRGPMPETVEELRKWPLHTSSMGGEPFSGWLGKMADGRVLLTTSLIRQAGSTIEITGLEKVKRFLVQAPITVNDAQRAQAEALPLAADPGQKRAVTYQASRVQAPLSVAGDNTAKAWETLRRTSIDNPTSSFKGEFSIGYDQENLYLQVKVDDSSPWKNTGRNFATLFKTGDAIDLQIGPGEPEGRKEPGVKDQRIMIAPFQGKATAVLLRPVDPDAKSSTKHIYRSPVMERSFDRVEIIDSVKLHVDVKEAATVVRAVIPFNVLGLNPTKGEKLRADIGFISSDENGTQNIARTYWSNWQTNLVNDEPSEAWLNPERWGTLVFE